MQRPINSPSYLIKSKTNKFLWCKSRPLLSVSSSFLIQHLMFDVNQSNLLKDNSGMRPKQVTHISPLIYEDFRSRSKHAEKIKKLFFLPNLSAPACAYPCLCRNRDRQAQRSGEKTINQRTHLCISPSSYLYPIFKHKSLEIEQLFCRFYVFRLTKSNLNLKRLT